MAGPQLSPRDRSLVTVAALTVGGNPGQLTFHLQYAKANGATEEELIEAVGTQESMMQAIRSTRPGGHVDFDLPLQQAAEGYRAMDERRAIKTLLRR